MHARPRARVEKLKKSRTGAPLELTGDTAAKSLPANEGDERDVGSISGLGRSSGGGNGKPL